MSRIQWHNQDAMHVQAGLDRGVLYPQGTPAVAWNGLVSVKESGSQKTESYYVNGRKFLTTVTPREYTASISAVTFPDEFAELCGIVEAADGLFFDAQVPDQFGLSYRTMYGDGKHYKIHLIYGATAAVSDSQYETLSDGANDPSTFDFDISAIPQTIPGFRPTAHVIVDSRNLEGSLANIENMLYGTYGMEAALPPIQTLFEMMSFGDLVVVTDHGDGTWTAEGSYKYISVNDAGVFTIKNVPIEDYNNDIYSFAGTNETIIHHPSPLPPPSAGGDTLDGGSSISRPATAVDGGLGSSSGNGVLDGGIGGPALDETDGGILPTTSSAQTIDGGSTTSSGSGSSLDGGRP